MTKDTLAFLLVVTLLSASTAVDAAGVVGVMCRQNTTQPKVLEIEKKKSGDLVARISGYELFGNLLPQARSIEVTLQLSNCQPQSVGHWMDSNLYTCVGPDEPKIRDANGEPVALPATFQRLYFHTYMETYPYLFQRRNRFHFDLRVTVADQVLQESDEFATDPDNQNHCRLRYGIHEKED